MGKLDGQVTIITGAASGIGREVAKLFAAEGAKVVCAARTMGDTTKAKEGTIIPSVAEVKVTQVYDRSLADTVAEIQKAGGTAIGIQTDVTNEESLDFLVYNTKRLFGPVDVLVNDAVLNYALPIIEYPVKWWEECFATNVHAPFMLSQKVLRHMIERRKGHIVNISSGVAIGPGRGPYKNSIWGSVTMYGTTKAAIERFTQGLAEEVYPYGVAVACVSPSLTVVTGGTKYHKITDVIPQNFIEPPELLIKAILLLATEPVDKITGRVCYSQQILKEYGLIKEAHGPGADVPGSGFSHQ